MFLSQQLLQVIEMVRNIDSSFEGEKALGLKSAILAPVRSLILTEMGNWSAEQREEGVAFIRATNLNTQCPISLEDLTDANIHEFIMLPSGFVFKKEELQKWIYETESFHNPATNLKFTEFDTQYLIRKEFRLQRPNIYHIRQQLFAFNIFTRRQAQNEEYVPRWQLTFDFFGLNRVNIDLVEANTLRRANHRNLRNPQTGLTVTAATMLRIPS